MLTVFKGKKVLGFSEGWQVMIMECKRMTIGALASHPSRRGDYSGSLPMKAGFLD